AVLGLGTDLSAFCAPWAWAFDTPFKWMKQVASHYGGTAQGVAMSWPGHINDQGGIRRQFHHVIDIVPTILEAAGISQPETINGIKQNPMDGVSMAYTWDKANANAASHRTTQYFEMLGNRAIYHEGWVAATTPATLPWGTEHQVSSRRDHRIQLGAVQRRLRPHRIRRLGHKRCRVSSRRCRTCSTPRPRSTTCCRSTIQRSRAGTRRVR